MMGETEKKLRGTVKKLFKAQKINLFIGYSKGTLPLTTTPCFVRSAKDAEKLVWDSGCFNNLAVYLPGLFRQKKKEKLKVGILAKGCDCRSIVGLIKENQVKRENLYIIGVPCDGKIDMNKVKDKMRNNIEIVKAREKNEEIIITGENGKEWNFKKKDLLAEVCSDCQHSTPPVYDILIGAETKNEKSKKQSAIVEEFEKKSVRERREYFEKEFSKCIRCGACRMACPNCYCPECFSEQTRPKWAGITNNISDVMFYQIGRIFHQAGRCVDCGACERACPMGIDLRILTKKLIKDVKEYFDYEAGISPDEPPPLATFKPEDKQEFITEPE